MKPPRTDADMIDQVVWKYAGFASDLVARYLTRYHTSQERSRVASANHSRCHFPRDAR
jgi:hypothetical protein